MTSLLSLPPELLLHITSYHTPPTILSLMRTNHALHHLLHTSHALAESIFNDIAYATSAVYHAAKRGDKQTIQRLVKSDILDAVKFRLNTAVLNKSAQVIGTLLECGVPADTRNGWGETPLISAARFGRVEVVRLLLARKGSGRGGLVDVNSVDNRRMSALAYAAYKWVEVVKVLLDRADIDVNARDTDGRSALYHALGFWSAWKNVAILLEDARVDVNLRDRLRRTPLHLAVSNGKAAALNMLLDCERVDVNAEDQHHRSPLCTAVQLGSPTTVHSLLQRKDVNVNARCPLGMSALSHAISSSPSPPIYRQYNTYAHQSKQFRDIIALLLADPRVEVNLPDHELRTPLHLALRRGRRYILDMLLKREGVEVNARDKDGFTPLGYAIHFLDHGKWWDKLVKLLLEDARVDVNLANDEGLTPLHIAVIERKVPLVRLLLAGGKVDRELVDGKGLKAEEYVVGAGELFEGVFEEQWSKVVFGWVMKRFLLLWDMAYLRAN
ncbi:ankyrin [Choiromyces venosus 120613-1]|uniref:Ankyrin n=1 Tax=Choiromyces venosus 120613-1 TaxID=1336337 RepID=A0A3N4JKJ3_9PEZI|nr:ankyrin [Choiromyces venosus 120613-1]